MSETRIKVCGITSIEDALAAIDCGAQYLGFNFYRPSPRYIEPEAARGIIEALPSGIIPVGVFVNEPGPETVIALLEASGATMAQLHGDESPEYCHRVGPERVIRALRAGPGFDPETALEYPADAILLDAFDKKLYGGTGRTADWSIAAEVARRAKLFLAGGLSPANIIEAIRTVRPFAVDLNSGVETAPGVKDHGKLRELKKVMEGL